MRGVFCVGWRVAFSMSCRSSTSGIEFSFKFILNIVKKNSNIVNITDKVRDDTLTTREVLSSSSFESFMFVSVWSTSLSVCVSFTQMGSSLSTSRHDY